MSVFIHARACLYAGACVGVCGCLFVNKFVYAWVVHVPQSGMRSQRQAPGARGSLTRHALSARLRLSRVVVVVCVRVRVCVRAHVSVCARACCVLRVGWGGVEWSAHVGVNLVGSSVQEGCGPGLGFLRCQCSHRISLAQSDLATETCLRVRVRVWLACRLRNGLPCSSGVQHVRT